MPQPKRKTPRQAATTPPSPNGSPSTGKPKPAVSESSYSGSSPHYPNGMPQDTMGWHEAIQTVATSDLPETQRETLVGLMMEDRRIQQQERLKTLEASAADSTPSSDPTTPETSSETSEPPYWEPRSELLRVEDYPAYVVETTNRMLWLIGRELQDMQEMLLQIFAANPQLGEVEPSAFKQTRLMFEMAQTVCEMMNLSSQPEPPDLLVPDKALVDPNGRPLKHDA